MRPSRFRRRPSSSRVRAGYGSAQQHFRRGGSAPGHRQGGPHPRTASVTASRPSPFCPGDGDEPPSARPRDRRSGFEGADLRLGTPLVCDEPAATHERAADEHGRLAVLAATNRLRLGDKIRLIPGHCDPTVNPQPLLSPRDPPDLAREREGRVGARYVCARGPRRAGLADHREGWFTDQSGGAPFAFRRTSGRIV
jgi:hypothetical protein